MDAVPLRKRCETCVFHRAGNTPCTGICLNRTWQPRTGAERLVRERELACYRGWGGDSWAPKSLERKETSGPGSPGTGTNGANAGLPPASTQRFAGGASTPVSAIDRVIEIVPFATVRYHQVDELVAVAFADEFH